MANDKIALKNKDTIKFLKKNCIHANIIKNVTAEKNKVSTILTNLNFDIIIVLTRLIILNLLDNLI